MFKNIIKRWLIITLSMIMVLQFMPYLGMEVYAAGSINTGIEGLSVTYDNGTWNRSGNVITGSVKTQANSGCTGTTYTSVTGILTVSNTGSQTGVLSFYIQKTDGGGTFTVKDNSGAVVTSEMVQIILGPNESCTVTVTSDGTRADTTVVEISGLDFTIEKDSTVTLAAPVNGSYTLTYPADHTEDVTQETVKTISSTVIVQLKATPASGYKFTGWFDELNSTYISFDSSWSGYFTYDSRIVPRFELTATPVFETGGLRYTDLAEAADHARNNPQDRVITLVSDGTLPSGDYSIPSGVILLIPFDKDKTLYTDKPSVIYNEYSRPTAYRTLTMASGASITVENGGAISLSGKLSSKGQMGGYNGTPTGYDGRIKMEEGSSIILRSGANLYVWGYIYGSGSVTAESGSAVYEAFQIKDWRGGSATSNIYDYAFIFSQYYIQNIEVPLTMYAGAVEKVHSSANASSSAYPISGEFIGNNGIFRINSGYIVKDYIESTDRLQFDIYGDMELSSMSISGIPVIESISTSRYVLPLNGNFTVNIHSGTTTVKQNLELLPGFDLTVDSGATASIDSKVYVYDNDDWGNFTGKARLYVIGYSVANGTTTKRTAAGLVDARIDINGTFVVNGNLYTSLGGADITSSEGTGRVVLPVAVSSGNVTLYEMANNSTKTAVTFTPAQLRNGDNTYFGTAGSSKNTEIVYVKNRELWHLDSFSVTFADGEGNVLQSITGAKFGDTVAFTEEVPSKDADIQYTYTFDGWTIQGDESQTVYGTPDNPLGTVFDDTTYVAHFATTVNTYTVIFNDASGDQIVTVTGVPYGDNPDPTDVPTFIVSDEGVVMVFTGWRLNDQDEVITDLSEVTITGDTVLTAVYEELKDPEFKSQSLLLSGRIGVVFYMDLPNSDVVDYSTGSMLFEISGKGTCTAEAFFDPNNRSQNGKYFGFTCYVSSIQMADTITATFRYNVNGTEKSVEKEYRVKDYFDSFDAYLENNLNAFPQKTIELVHSVADYGHYIQPYLSSVRGWAIGMDYAEMDKYYSSSYDLETIKTVAEQYAFSRTDLNADIEAVTYSLTFDDNTVINVYFKPVAGYEGSFSAAVDGADAEFTIQPDGRCKVVIPNIPAQSLDTMHEVSLRTDNGFITVNVSGLSYVNSFLKNKTDEASLNAAAAIYHYWKAAHDALN